MWGGGGKRGGGIKPTCFSLIFSVISFYICIMCYDTIQYNTTLLPIVNTVARGMFCGPKYTHHTFTPIMKHL